MMKRLISQISVSAVLVTAFAVALAQTPNTGSMVVVGEDRNGAVVRDARVSIVNDATGATRDGVTGSEGSVTVAALSLTGTYTVTVAKDGFGTETRKDIALRSGETAT